MTRATTSVYQSDSYVVCNIGVGEEPEFYAEASRDDL